MRNFCLNYYVSPAPLPEATVMSAKLLNANYGLISGEFVHFCVQCPSSLNVNLTYWRKGMRFSVKFCIVSLSNLLAPSLFNGWRLTNMTNYLLDIPSCFLDRIADVELYILTSLHKVAALSDIPNFHHSEFNRKNRSIPSLNLETSRNSRICI